MNNTLGKKSCQQLTRLRVCLSIFATHLVRYFIRSQFKIILILISTTSISLWMRLLTSCWQEILFSFFSPIFSFDAQTFRSKSYNDSPFAYLLPKLDSVGAHRFPLLFLPARYFARNRTARATVPHESNHVFPHYAHTYICKRCRRSFCRDPRARTTCGEGLM